MHRPLSELIDFDKFELYSKALVESLDVDPVYPLLQKIIEKEGFDPIEAVFHYAYFYSIESMILFLRANKTNFVGLKYGIERARTPQIRRIENYYKTYNYFFQSNLIKQSYLLDSRAFAEEIMKVPYFGPWVSYKITELFEKVLDRTNLAPVDMNIANGDVNDTLGPCGGLRELYGKEVQYPQSIAAEWEALGKTLSARWNYDLGKVETCFCKYSKLKKGNYYIGHDIAEFKHLEHLYPAGEFNKMMAEIGFEEPLWKNGIVSENKRLYKDKGILLNANYAERYRG